MRTLINPGRAEWASLIRRPVQNFEDIEIQVKPIMESVKEGGDATLIELTQKFDKVKLDGLEISKTELESVDHLVPDDLKEAIKIAKANIEKFHLAQLDDNISIETMPGVRCSRKSVPIQRVGLYIPGGSAPLFSTVLMLGIPASIAGCQEIVLCTPPNRDGDVDPTILYTAALVGIKRIFKVGGAQAIAAMTFGTETIQKVDKLFGPGNQYVTAAKQLATKYGMAIDMPAGPSELLVMADVSCVPAFVAADLLSQAEHGEDSQVILVTDSELVLDEVRKALEQQLSELPRRVIAQKALTKSLFILLNKEQGMEFTNQYGPEHLILAISDAEAMANEVLNAGSVFLGNYSPESAGDYASGTNHTLPTNGAARAYSGVSVDSFVKKITYQKISRQGLRNLGPTIEMMAAAEQLEAHKNAVSIRLKYDEDV